MVEQSPNGGSDSGPGPSTSTSTPKSPEIPQKPTPTLDEMISPRSSIDNGRVYDLEQELQIVRQEKDTLSTQYRGLLGKLTAMRTTLGDKLREDAEELDRRETTINNLTNEMEELQNQLKTIQDELESTVSESTNLSTQLTQLRSQSDSSSSDVLSLTREMRELRGEMERLRSEREEWEGEAMRERERRELVEEEMRGLERREREGRKDWERGRDDLEIERQRARNLQDVLGEFQAAKDSELRQATSELESQLKMAATSLSEYKLRAANAETRLSELSNDASRSTGLEKELKEKNQIIGKLRHDAVVNNEHLTEALRRLRKNSSDNNVDRRLVTNILLSFLLTPRADPKRFEMLSLLSTILQWDDRERERAGLQRVGGNGKTVEKGKKKSEKVGERSAEEEAVINESFGNLFVEFLLKEASQGQQRSSPQPNSDPTSPKSPPTTRSYSITSTTNSPPTSGANTPSFFSSRPRGYSNSSSMSAVTSFADSNGREKDGRAGLGLSGTTPGGGGAGGGGGGGPGMGPGNLGSSGRKLSGLQQALQGSR